MLAKSIIACAFIATIASSLIIVTILIMLAVAIRWVNWDILHLELAFLTSFTSTIADLVVMIEHEHSFDQ